MINQEKINKIIQFLEDNKQNYGFGDIYDDFIDEHFDEFNEDEISFIKEQSNQGIASYSMLLGMYYYLDDDDKAISYLELTLSQDKFFDSAFIVLLDLANIDDNNFIDFLLSYSDKYSVSNYCLGCLYLNGVDTIHANFEKAEYYFNKAIKQNPNNFYYKNSLLTILFLEKKDDAVALCEKYIEEGNPYAYIWKGNFISQGKYGFDIDYDEAITWYKKAINFDKDYYALKSIANTSLQQLYFTMGDSSFDENKMNKSLEEVDESGCILTFAIKGISYLYGKYNTPIDYEEAEKYLLKASRQTLMSTNGSAIYYHLGHLYSLNDFKNMNLDKSLEYYYKAKELGFQCDDEIKKIESKLSMNSEYLEIKKYLDICKGESNKRTFTLCLENIENYYSYYSELIDGNSFTSISVGLLTYVLFSSLREPGLDYISAFSPIIKAFECEIKKYFVKYFAIYLKYSNTFDTIYNKRLSEKEKNIIISALNDEPYDFSLGNLKYYLLKEDKQTKELKIKDYFLDYFKYFFNSTFNENYFMLGRFIPKIKEIDEFVRKYRNPVTHEKEMTKSMFEEASSEILFDIGFLEFFLMYIKKESYEFLTNYENEEILLKHNTGIYKTDIDNVLEAIKRRPYDKKLCDDFLKIVDIKNNYNYKEVFKMLKELSNKNYSKASNFLGRIYNEGFFNQELNYNKAEEYYLKAINEDVKFKEVYWNLGVLYSIFNNPNKDYNQSIDYFLKASELGYQRSTDYLGRIYADGLLNQKIDYQKAEEYFLKAIDQDNNYSESYYNLGNLYKNKNNPNYNVTKALDNYLKASDLGLSKASNYLGSIFENGYLDQPKDYDKSSKFYSKAIDQDRKDNLYYWNLARLYEKNDNPNKNYEKAIANYDKSSNLGNMLATFHLGRIFYNGLLNQEINYEKAEKYYLKAIEQYDEDGRFYWSLGKLYENKNNPNKNSEKALLNYIKASELGYNEASNYIGKVYFEGLLGQTKDYQKAETYFVKASNQNGKLSEIFYNMARLYECSDNPKKDLDKSFENYLKASDAGNTTASMYLASAFENGNLNQKIDYKKAEEYYLKTISQDNCFSFAHFYLAFLYGKNDNPYKDYEKAIEHYEKASNLKFVVATSNLAKIYHMGLLNQQIDYSKAEKYYLKAIEQLNRLNSLYYDIAIFYESSKNPLKNIEKAIENYDIASKLGYAKASNYLGTIYFMGLLNQSIDYNKAELYYLKSIDQDKRNSSPYWNLGNLYSNKDNPNKKEDVALSYYKKASDLGFPNADNYLGRIYYNGFFNQEKDYKKAEDYYLKAINENNLFKEAYWNLAILYEDDDYINKDYTKALKNYKEASKLGSAKSSNYLGRVYAEGLLEQDKNYQMAEEYYLKAIEQDNMYNAVYYNLAKLFENEDNPGKNYTKSLEYYKKASELGNSKASSYLSNVFETGLLGQKIDLDKAKEYHNIEKIQSKDKI